MCPFRKQCVFWWWGRLQFKLWSEHQYCFQMHSDWFQTKVGVIRFFKSASSKNSPVNTIFKSTYPNGGFTCYDKMVRQKDMQAPPNIKRPNFIDRVYPYICSDKKEFFLTHWGQDKMAAIFWMAFSNAFSWMKMYKFRLRFQWSLFPSSQLTIS